MAQLFGCPEGSGKAIEAPQGIFVTGSFKKITAPFCKKSPRRLSKEEQKEEEDKLIEESFGNLEQNNDNVFDVIDQVKNPLYYSQFLVQTMASEL